MKSLYALILLVSVYFCSGSGTVNAHTITDSIHHSSPDQDSIPDTMLLSAEGEEKASLFKGVIPLSPQSHALARYAEYPVSHTTGIPDITIPLYEVHLGAYTLPISVSYHAAGARVDDVPTCVGQGWTLNAGGAVFRTVMGTPDQPASIGINRRYMEVENVRQLIMEKKSDSPYGYSQLLKLLVDNDRQFDTESDRFSYNVGGLTGLFRYDINDGVFKTLDHAPHSIKFQETLEGSAFTIRDAAGNGYYLGRNEMSCPSDDGNGLEYTSAWYVDRITTQYGAIGFSYLPGHKKIIYKRSNITVEAGEHPDVVDGYATFRYAVRKREVEFDFRQDQSLVAEITWEGNRICFSYTEDSSKFGGPARLDSMTVYGSDGSVRKKIEFSYFTWYERGNSGNGRHMLSAIKDSETGIYTFKYYGTNTGTGLPHWRDNGDSAVYSDLWGFYNGGSRLRPVLTKKIAEKLTDKLHNEYPEWADRDPDLSCTLKGVLSTVTFPTGGSVKYTYELNSAVVNGKPYTVGGLRVSRVEINNGVNTTVKKYSYLGTLTQDDPESRMMCEQTLVMGGVPPYTAFQYILPWRSVSSYPIGYSYAPSNPVAYTSVTETAGDGSRIEYGYDRGDLVDIAEGRDCPHPSTWSPSLSDPGRRQPRLEERRVFDSCGNEVFRESFEYAKGVEETITTGVRLYSNATWTEYGYDDRSFSDVDESLMTAYPLYPQQRDYMFFHQTTALRVPCVPSRRTEEDMVTGFKTVTDYSYDTAFRTLQPRFATVTNSDGTSYRTEWTYPFNHSDISCSEMTNYGLNDIPVEKRVYSGQTLLSMERTDYNLAIPEKLSSWSVPTGTDPATAISTLTEHERVLSFNIMGRPLSVKVNGTDETSFKWDSTGTLLESMTAPGGLKSTYTHRPLFGVASITQPNGYQTKYTYNDAGMLTSVADGNGPVEAYSYSIASHQSADMTGAGNSVTTTRFLNTSGPSTVRSRRYHDGLGRPTTVTQGGVNTSGKYIYTAVSYDALGRESQTVLPSVGGSDLSGMSFINIKALSTSTYNDQYAWSETSYDALDRPVKTTTPGDAWHTAGKAKTTEYISNAASSVRLYRAPMDRISLVEDGYYAAKTLQGVRTVDEDGNEMTVYTDRLGRKVLERRGPESKKGQNDTYFVYNALGQLRYVLSPGYEKAGYKDEYAYEYRYDEHGNVVKKFIPGAGYTQYWYDHAGRMSYMQDPNLREEGLHRFFVYDRAGRLAIQGVSASCSRGEAVNFADYTGGTGGFMQTGYTLQNASRIQQVILEVVNYYDTYTFASALDASLYKASSVSAKGLQTGSVVYNSDNTRSLSAVYYDIRGNVTESRERTAFGTLRTTVNTYTYIGLPLKSTVTEGSVTTVTENTYDTASGLLTATDVTVNGVKQRVSAVEYDDLGRIASVTRGASANSGGKVSYKYNIHGQTTEINGPGLTQSLYYADGLGKKLYNGSVSAMTWTMGTDTRVRGYKYTYNGYGWLTAAEYGEHSNLGTNTNRYTERFLEFMPNGGVRRMQRHGLKADGVYGKVDNLHISYDGNRISSVLEDAAAVTQNGSMDYPGGNREMSFGYNGWGALVKDESRGITDISYDRSGNPLRISFSDGSYTENVYSASGEKLKTTHATSLNGTVAGKTTTEYRGNVIYRDGKVDMVLFPGGYATINGSSVTFHYYTQDYLGNNRAVINGSTGAIEQLTAYYPYGGVIADLGTNQISGQPYKFGGKELITANGLNEYDFGARWYYTAVPNFTKPDSHCEKYYWLSPYLYCGNNPVNFSDPTGKIIEMPSGSTTEQIMTVMWNMQQITNDRLVFNTQKDGTIRIKIASLGEGNKSNGTRLIRSLNSSSKTVTILPTHGFNGETRESNFDSTNGKGTNTTVLFNADSNPNITILDEKTGRVIDGNRPSYIGLAHELIHADRDMRGVSFNAAEDEYHSFTNYEGEPDVERIPKEESATVGFNHIKPNGITENAIRREHRLPLRGTYRSYRRNK